MLGISGRKRERASARETREGCSCAHYFQAPAMQAKTHVSLGVITTLGLINLNLG